MLRISGHKKFVNKVSKFSIYFQGMKFSQIIGALFRTNKRKAKPDYINSISSRKKTPHYSKISSSDKK